MVVVLAVGLHYSILRLYVTHQWSYRGSVAALRLELVAWIYQCSGVHRSEQGGATDRSESGEITVISETQQPYKVSSDILLG